MFTVGVLIAAVFSAAEDVHAAPADELTQVVLPSEDTYVAKNKPGTPQNNQPELWVVGDSLGENSIHMKFMVPAAPPGTELVSATLGMTTISTNKTINNERNRALITQTSVGWNADTLTFNNRPARDAVHVTGAHVNGTNYFYPYPLNVGLVKAHGAGMMGIGMFRESNGNEWFAFHSKEAPVADAQKPHIKFVFKDIQPPSAPLNLAAMVAAKNVTLSWAASTDNIGVTGYRVYRGATANFAPTPSNLKVGS